MSLLCCVYLTLLSKRLYFASEHLLMRFICFMEIGGKVSERRTFDERCTMAEIGQNSNARDSRGDGKTRQTGKFIAKTQPIGEIVW